MEPKADLELEGLVRCEPKREYRRPILVTFGRIAALTRSSVCSAANDGNTLATCSPGAMAMMSSDRNLKENIVRVASHPLGFSLYLFDYQPALRNQWGHGRQFGVMADEVETVMPEAVSMHPDGYKMVNYELLGITQFRH